MKRSIEQELLKWKNDPRKKPLLLRGARQVGKTFVVREIGKTFDQFIELNFERNPEFKSFFHTLEPQKILQSIELMLDQTIIPGKTLVFLDEIQECPNAIMALRYFKEEMQDLHIIGAGSLLEFVLNDEDFRMPVGRVQSLYLSPFSFFEFLEASENSKLKNFLSSISLQEKIPEAIHEKLLSLVKQYTVLGGMPAVIEDFLDSKSYQKAQETQTDILTTYRADFGKYQKNAGNKHLQVLFEKAPGLIAQWFKYSKVDPDIQSRELKKALMQLFDAGLIHPVYASSAQGVPLVSTMNEKKFKLLFLDIGLVHRAMRLNSQTLVENDLFLINQGALTEQFVGQQLMVNPHEKKKLFFWVREARNSSAEVDYVLNIDASIVPIEVKSGSTGRLRSMKIFLEEKDLPLGIRVSQNPLSLDENILSIPFYLTEEIPRLFQEALALK